MMKYPQAKILVFAKAPIPGEVKTRLAENVGAVAAAQVHEHLVRYSLKEIIPSNLAPVELWCAPDSNHPFFEQCKKTFKLRLMDQGDGDLGRRMQRALSDALLTAQYVLLVGTDCPVMDYHYLDHALSRLAAGVETVLGPAEDGGYVLLGTRNMVPEIFQDIAWGGQQVLSQTLNKLSGGYELLPRLWDVERYEDLRRIESIEKGFLLNDEFKEFLKTIHF